MITAKALGHFSPYGSYWVALSLINDGMDEQIIEKYVSHVENWSKTHLPLRPRYLHLRAELACTFDAFEAPCVINRSDFKAINLFDQAILEAERQSLLDCSAFINERYGANRLASHDSCGEFLKRKFGVSSRAYTGYMHDRGN